PSPALGLPVSVAHPPPPRPVLGFGLSRRSGVLGVPPVRVLALGTASAACAAPPSRRSGGRGPQPPRALVLPVRRPGWGARAAPCMAVQSVRRWCCRTDHT